MTEYEFRTTRSGTHITQIARIKQLESGLLLPTALAEVHYANTDPIETNSALHIPTAFEVAQLGLDNNPNHDVAPDVIEQYSFVERDLNVFGRRAVQTCVEIIDATEATKVALVMSPGISDDEKELIQSLNVYIGRRSSGRVDGPTYPAPNTGMYM